MMGRLPTEQREIEARLMNAHDAVLDATLEREIQAERKLRARLDLVQLRIRLIQREKASRRDAGLLVGYDPS